MWAIEIVRDRFKKGMERVFDGPFMQSRFDDFVLRADPVYATMLAGMDDDGVARAVVGNWMIAHTLATQARFWLEDAIVDLLVARAEKSKAPRPQIFSLGILADGWYKSGRSVWDVGEHWREELHGRGGWRPLIQERALDEIERQVGDEERAFESIPPSARRDTCITVEQDAKGLARAAAALSGPARPILVRCNLLIMEPERSDREPHIWGIRYINPTTFNQASTIKAERVNLLRLRAYLAQEKPFRAPAKIEVAIAALLPRPHREESAGRIGAHFSPYTRWSAERLWEFLEVPFAAVTAGIREAGAFKREELARELRALLKVEAK